MEYKDFSFELDTKADGDDNEPGTFTGMASVAGNEDLQGDIVDQGAFARTLKKNKGEVPILWQHDPSNPIGIAKVEEVDKGLRVTKGVLDLNTQKGQEAYSLLKKKDGFLKSIIRAMSIGYEVRKSEPVDGARHLKEVDLWEISLVTFPANPMALVAGVKANTEEEKTKLEALEKRVRTLESHAANRRLKAVESALASEGISLTLEASSVTEPKDTSPGDSDGDAGRSPSLSELLEATQLAILRKQVNE